MPPRAPALPRDPDRAGVCVPGVADEDHVLPLSEGAAKQPVHRDDGLHAAARLGGRRTRRLDGVDANDCGRAGGAAHNTRFPGDQPAVVARCDAQDRRVAAARARGVRADSRDRPPDFEGYSQSCDTAAQRGLLLSLHVAGAGGAGARCEALLQRQPPERAARRAIAGGDARRDAPEGDAAVARPLGQAQVGQASRRSLRVGARDVGLLSRVRKSGRQELRLAAAAD
mmetsp:Transcript_57735/g.132596  ORF Transcript_57735/g.132596 Transcript_57735/m.132596 type:complete len:227 (+) Transcript_57735:457-1137(+)